MNFLRITTKIFAAFSLLFAVFIQTNAQTDSVYDLRAGTKIRVAMDNEINSRVASAGDTFTTTLAEPLIIRETVILPVGTVIEGRITKVRRAAAGGKNGSLTVSFDTIHFTNGAKRPIEAVLVKQPTIDDSPKFKAFSIIGATAVGAIIGAVSKANNGALLGAGIGAGAGTGIAFLQKGKNVNIKADAQFEIELVKNVILPAQDF